MKFIYFSCLEGIRVIPCSDIIHNNFESHCDYLLNRDDILVNNIVRPFRSSVEVWGYINYYREEYKKLDKKNLRVKYSIKLILSRLRRDLMNFQVIEGN